MQRPARAPRARKAGLTVAQRAGRQTLTYAVVVVPLFGVVIGFQDLDQVLQGGVGAVALGTQDHNVAV